MEYEVRYYYPKEKLESIIKKLKNVKQYKHVTFDKPMPKVIK